MEQKMERTNPHPYQVLSYMRPNQVEMLNFFYNAEYKIVYQTFEFKHAPYLYKKSQNKQVKSQQIERQYHVMAQKLHTKILKEEIDAEKALNRLEHLWQQRGTPIFHRYYVEKYIYSGKVKHSMQLIKNQQALIFSQQHILYPILRCIKARQLCLNSIKKQLTNLSQQSVNEHLHIVRERIIKQRRKEEQKDYQIHGYKVKLRLDQREDKLGETLMEVFMKEVGNLGKLTVHCIGLIAKWKEYIGSLTPDLKKRRDRIEFYHHQNNYLLKILSDTNFMANTFLSNFFLFSTQNDPFFLKPILMIEKKHIQTRQQTSDENQLKKIFLPSLEDLNEVLTKIEILFLQYSYNIKNRRIYNLSDLQKIRTISVDKIKDSRIDSPNRLADRLLQVKSDRKPLKTIKMAKEISLSKNRNLRKQLLNPIPVSFSKTHFENFLIRSKVSTKNKQIQSSRVKNTLQTDEDLIDSKMLASLKEDVYNKVKGEIKIEERKNLIQSRVIDSYVDQQVREKLKQIAYQTKLRQSEQQSIELRCLSFSQSEIITFINKIYKATPSQFQSLQISEKQILKVLQEAEYCYIVQLHTPQKILSHVIATVDRETTSYKSIIVHYISFLNPYFLEKIILKFVNFIWKYENAYDILFKFNQISGQEEQASQLLHSLQKSIEHNCTVASKKRSDNKQEKTYIFRRKNKNTNEISNKYPTSMFIKLDGLISDQKLCLELVEERDLQKYLHYDIILMEIFRKFTNSEDFLVIRDSFKPSERLKCILILLMDIDKNPNRDLNLNIIEAENITSLNKILIKHNQPILQVSDLQLSNTMKLIQLEINLSFPFQLKVFSDGQGKKFHRFSIDANLQILVGEDNTKFIFLPVSEHKNLSIILFDSKSYLQEGKKNLHTYLYRVLQKSKEKLENMYVDHLWVQMTRFPLQIKERQSSYLTTYRIDELKSIKKDLYIGDKFQWFCDIQLRNGINFKQEKKDYVIENPLGMALLEGQENSLLYARVFQ